MKCHMSFYNRPEYLYFKQYNSKGAYQKGVLPVSIGQGTVVFKGNNEAWIGKGKYGIKVKGEYAMGQI